MPSDLMDVRRDEDFPPPVGALSVRELEVLQMLANVGTNARIAEALHLPVETVKSRLKNAFPKLGARGRAHAVAICFRAGLIR